METISSKMNILLRQARKDRCWTQEEVADELYKLCVGSRKGARGDINANMVSRWERGLSPSPFWQKHLCNLYQKSPRDLGFGIQTETHKTFPYIAPTEEVSSFLDLGIIDKLDTAESIIGLAWETWFASRPREAARAVNKLLPNLEKIAYSPYSFSQTVRTKNLVVRAHSLLGSVCMDVLQYDTALFHHMQAHRFAEEIHDIDLATTSLCLIGEVLRRQKDLSGALSHMENARDLASKASNVTRGHILQLLAYTYGDAGQEAAFENTIAEATDLLAFSGEGVDTLQKEFTPFEVYEIRGKINRDLGKPLNAILYLDLAEKALVLATSVTPRWQALLEISRAQAYCDTGDIVTGIELACKGFIMAYQCHSPHQMNRVRKLLSNLGIGPFRNHPRVQDLTNLIYETYMRMDTENVSKLSLPASF